MPIRLPREWGKRLKMLEQRSGIAHARASVLYGLLSEDEKLWERTYRSEERAQRRADAVNARRIALLGASAPLLTVVTISLPSSPHAVPHPARRDTEGRASAGAR